VNLVNQVGELDFSIEDTEEKISNLNDFKDQAIIFWLGQQHEIPVWPQSSRLIRLITGLIQKFN